jgi:uncharacterized membrane protein YkvA (DUF1232 family)
MGLRERIGQSARKLKREIIVIYFAARDPRTPWWIRFLALLIAGYVLSPIDLIPDFIPVLGYLDDVVLVPLAIKLLMRMLPPGVVADARERAAKAGPWPKSALAAGVVVLLWLAFAAWLVMQLF